MADSDHEWRRWGERDPYFGVLADPRFRKDRIEDNRTEFFELGRLTVEERLATATEHFGSFERGRALDFGCGVGRLSLALAAHFDEVLGIDVAPAMLAEAGANAKRVGINNLRLALSDDALNQAVGSFDFVMSSMVLQHIPARRGLPMIKAMLDRLAPGGIAALQICLARQGSMASHLRFWVQCHVPGVHQLVNLKRGRPMSEPFMQMNGYDLDRVLALADAESFDPPLIQTSTAGRFVTGELLIRRRP